MTKLLKNLLISLFFVAFILNPFKSNALENTYCRYISCNKAACDLRMSERKLWIDHVTLTRSFIVSDLASLEDKSDVLERLLKNQEDIGNSLKPYYGEEAGSKLSTLLEEHIEITGQVTDAAKNNNKDNLEKYNKLWYENAEKILLPPFFQLILYSVLLTFLKYNFPNHAQNKIKLPIS